MRETATAASLGLRLSWGLRMAGLDLRRHASAALLAAGAFAAMAGALALASVGAEVPAPPGSFAATAQLVAFLRDDIPPSARDDLASALGRMPGVTGVRVLGSDEALGRLRAELGERAGVLDGVEEGFLPTSLEIALEPGPRGVGGADALAWRLRRLPGIADVDVLRSEADHRLLAEQARAHRLWVISVAEAAAVFLAALAFAALALRRPRADALVMAGLGFTRTAIAAPACLAGVAAGVVGGLLALIAVHVALRAGLWSSIGGRFELRFFQPRFELGVLAALAILGAALGWWGGRLPGTRVEELASDT
ncbi:MAG TPA: permease-like cell division protein FtsX [Polyangia bacterium]|nr:permease-like cell division protein FtsX [Polyangia bacterium]